MPLALLEFSILLRVSSVSFSSSLDSDEDKMEPELDPDRTELCVALCFVELTIVELEFDIELLTSSLQTIL